ncbi:MAG: hypothetical protein E7A07_00895, partial [Streptococcus sp.]|nr:hypothetical protein [Streptococcus sp.]
MAIAKIIVDVPLMQTDQPYSYKVPEEFVEMLEAGMRVHVPFGKGNRLIQGIVLGLESQSDEKLEDQDLKEIAEVLDFSSVLTQEQLWLTEELRKSVFSYKISILKAMLPPPTPEKPSRPSDSPKTGDNTNLCGLLALLLTS